MLRGQQDVYGWWRNCSNDEILGWLKDCMQSLAQRCLMAVQESQAITLRVLSLSDGNCADSTWVPTSVLLAHAFASLGTDAFPPSLACVKIVGADVGNVPWHSNSHYSWHWLPPWIELQHLNLDNNKDLASQFSDQQLSKFDVVLMRQGLCYCHDPSFDCQPPRKLHVAGLQGNGACNGPSSGTYFLEPDFRNGRPSYRRGRFLLHWRPEGPSAECGSGDWIVVGDDDERFIWANVVHDRGSPALAQNPWWVWDGSQYLADEDVSCEVAGPVPWKRPPHACECCGGISLSAGAVQSFVGRVAALLDERRPRAFALLQGGL